MTVEAREGGQPNNPVQEARGAFNKELLGREYQGGVLVTRTLQLHNALLRSSLTPEKVYHELAIIAEQGADRAEVFEDLQTASALRELQRGFELTFETFNPARLQAEAAQTAQPTRTEYLPPMTSAKGGEARPQKQVQTRTQNPSTTPASTPEGSAEPENSTATPELQTTSTEQQPDIAQQPEETFGSFLKQKRAEANLSQAKLGEAAGNLRQSVISAFERGIVAADPEKISQLASALGLDEEDTQKLKDLYNKQNPPKPQ